MRQKTTAAVTRRVFLKTTLVAGGGSLAAPRAFAPILWPQTGAACAVLVLVAAACAAVAIAHYCKKRWIVAFRQDEEKQAPVFECLDCMSLSNLAALGYTPCLGRYTDHEQCLFDARMLTAFAATNKFAAMPCVPIVPPLPAQPPKRLALDHSLDAKNWATLATLEPSSTSRGWLVVTATERASLTAAETNEITLAGGTLVTCEWRQARAGFFREMEVV